ncbi:MAG: metallophosphoesterase [Terracidiphilus sp.]
MAQRGKRTGQTTKRKAESRRELAERRNPFAFREKRGPFDIVGDVHGCFDELVALLAAMGYRIEQTSGSLAVTPPDGRTLAFVGDLVDRGPAAPAVLKLVMAMARAGTALSVSGNRDAELVRALRGRASRITRGMARSLEQLAKEPESFRDEVLEFLHGLPGHLVLDEGRLVIAHAGLKESLQGRSSAEARAIALHGDLTGEKDADGLPVHRAWAAKYRGQALVVHGHTPVSEPAWLNNTVNLDTGCAYGGHLTALRYPERAMFSIPARAIYYRPRRPFQPNAALLGGKR